MYNPVNFEKAINKLNILTKISKLSAHLSLNAPNLNNGINIAERPWNLPQS